MRRVQRLVLVLGTVFALVAGCGGDDGTTTATTATTSAAARRAEASWRALDRQVDQLADRGALLAVELEDGGSPRTVHAHHPTQIAPMGSIFKLYVLGALVEAVDAGRLRWDDPVTIRPGDASLAGGLETQPGATLPLRRLATLMIANSDNTAADAILRLVGRSAALAAIDLLAST